MEANAKKPKAKARPKLNPTENAALKRLEHDLITGRDALPGVFIGGSPFIHSMPVLCAHRGAPADSKSFTQ